jgi:hypothetical protein
MVGSPRGLTGSDIPPKAGAFRGGMGRSVLPLHTLASGEMGDLSGDLTPTGNGQGGSPPARLLRGFVKVEDQKTKSNLNVTLDHVTTKPLTC